MAGLGAFSVQNFRDEHESNSEWRMRKEFLASNFGAVPHDRLICLSRCFISIEVYGCTYPPEVMAQVQQLSENVNPKIMAKQRERMTQKYEPEDGLDESQLQFELKRKRKGKTKER